MYRLIESIRLEGGKFRNLRHHQRRMEASLRALSGTTRVPDLERLLDESGCPSDGLYKCRVVYDDRSADISFVPYSARPIRRIKVVADDNIAYPHKFEDRKALDLLYARRGGCDDILVVRNGEVTDSSFANIVFRQQGRWYTPASPLLAGTMRQYLIETGKIQVIAIRKEDIPTFQSFRLINAMIGFDGPEQDVANIIIDHDYRD